MSPAEIEWTRAEMTRAEQAGIERALAALQAQAATADRPPAPLGLRAFARMHALAELSLAHGHAVALEAQLVMAGAA